MRILVVLAVPLVSFMLGLAPCAFPQATSGAILGHVTDSSGAVIVDAAVSAKNEATGITRTSSTDASGYALRSLIPGTYTVTVSKTGFKAISHRGVLLLIDQQLTLDFKLTVGNVTESVTVTGEAPVLQTRSAETGEVIQSK